MNIIDNIAFFIIKPIVTLLIALAVLYFLYGLLKFIGNQDNPTEQEAGKRHMIWGVIGVFLMMTVGGILAIIDNTLNPLR